MEVKSKVAIDTPYGVSIVLFRNNAKNKSPET